MDSYDLMGLIGATAQTANCCPKMRLARIDYDFVVDHSYPYSGVRVIFDGETVPSEHGFMCLSSYTPFPGDRVLMIPVGSSYVIGGSVGSPANGGLSPKYDYDAGQGTRATNTYGDLTSADVGPTVTITTGTSAWVGLTAGLRNSGGGSSRMGYAVSGATTLSPVDERALSTFGVAGLHIGATFWIFEDRLNPGQNTFTAKYYASSGTGTFELRYLTVAPIPF